MTLIFLSGILFGNLIATSKCGTFYVALYFLWILLKEKMQNTEVLFHVIAQWLPLWLYGTKNSKPIMILFLVGWLISRIPAQ